MALNKCLCHSRFSAMQTQIARINDPLLSSFNQQRHGAITGMIDWNAVTLKSPMRCGLRGMENLLPRLGHIMLSRKQGA